MDEIQYMSSDGNFPFRILNKGFVNPRKHNSLYFERKNYQECTIEYVASGRGHLEINGETFDPGPDSLYILHKGSNHRYWTENDETTMWRKFCIVADGKFMTDLFHIHNLEHVYYIPDAADLKPYVDKMIHLNLNAPHVHEQAALFFHGLVVAIADKLRKKYEQERIPPVVRSLMERLIAHPEEKLNLRLFAKEAGYTPSYLITAFGECYKIAPLVYQQKLRYEQAIRLLSLSDLSIKEVAGQVGFLCQFSFSKFFRKRAGMSPLQFRQKVRKNDPVYP